MKTLTTTLQPCFCGSFVKSGIKPIYLKLPMQQTEGVTVTNFQQHIHMSWVSSLNCSQISPSSNEHDGQQVWCITGFLECCCLYWEINRYESYIPSHPPYCLFFFPNENHSSQLPKGLIWERIRQCSASIWKIASVGITIKRNKYTKKSNTKLVVWCFLCILSFKLSSLWK